MATKVPQPSMRVISYCIDYHSCTNSPYPTYHLLSPVLLPLLLAMRPSSFSPRKYVDCAPKVEEESSVGFIPNGVLLYGMGKQGQRM